MCGIAGIIQRNGSAVDTADIKRMCDAIRHRGPDGEGQWAEGNLGLGHRRLAIIDLTEAGHQPMLSGDGRYVLTYNGEIYNFRELRAELDAKGYRFHSRTDGEVIIHAYDAWGVDAIPRFNGMFAFALYDRRTKHLLLARDRYGIKPLYHASQGALFAFASEHKAIIALPGFKRTLDKEAMLEYFTFQNLFTERTLLADISMFPAGHYSIVNTENPVIAPTRYWDFHFQTNDAVVDAESYREELDRLFKQAVTRQLVSDVEIGSYLSGGMDSGSITAIAAREHPYLKTFTCGFDLSSATGIELAFDERSKAEALSARFRTEHYECVLKAGDMERVLPTLAWHLEEPRVGQSYPNYYAAKLARSHVKVVLSGSGGDELFAGYPWRYYRAAGSENFEQYTDNYYGVWQRLLSDAQIAPLLSPIWQDVSHVRPRDIFRGVFANHDNELKRPEDFINHSLYFEAKTFLHGLLVVEDKLSMAHGLENRVPFLDNDLVDFAMACPVSLKLNNLREIARINENETYEKRVHFQKTNDGKQILRDVMRRYIPADITDGVKQGFSAPDASWFKGESMEYVRRQLCEGDAHIYEYLDADTVRSLVGDHLNGIENRRLLIWSLLNMEQWLTQYLGS